MPKEKKREPRRQFRAMGFARPRSNRLLVPEGGAEKERENEDWGLRLGNNRCSSKKTKRGAGKSCGSS